jgi:hypothetical protein
MQDRDDRANPVKLVLVAHAGAISAKKSQGAVWGFRRPSSPAPKAATLFRKPGPATRGSEGSLNKARGDAPVLDTNGFEQGKHF